MNRPTNDEIYTNHRDLQMVDAVASAIEARQEEAAKQPAPERTTSGTTSLSIEDAVAQGLKSDPS